LKRKEDETLLRRLDVYNSKTQAVKILDNFEVKEEKGLYATDFWKTHLRGYDSKSLNTSKRHNSSINLENEENYKSLVVEDTTHNLER